MAKREVLLWNSRYIIPAPAYLTAESCEFAQRNDEIVKHVAEAIVGGDHGTLPVTSHPSQKKKVTGRLGSPSKSLRRLAWDSSPISPRKKPFTVKSV